MIVFCFCFFGQVAVEFDLTAVGQLVFLTATYAMRNDAAMYVQTTNTGKTTIVLMTVRLRPIGGLGVIGGKPTKPGCIAMERQALKK